MSWIRDMMLHNSYAIGHHTFYEELQQPEIFFFYRVK